MAVGRRDAAAPATRLDHPERAAKTTVPRLDWAPPRGPYTRTTRELAGLVHRAAGQARVRVRQVPPLLLRLVGLRDPAVREILEMAYLFEEPFVVDSSRITAELGVRATPAEQAIDETMAGYAESRIGGTRASAARDAGRPKV